MPELSYAYHFRILLFATLFRYFLLYLNSLASCLRNIFAHRRVLPPILRARPGSQAYRGTQRTLSLTSYLLPLGAGTPSATRSSRTHLRARTPGCPSEAELVDSLQPPLLPSTFYLQTSLSFGRFRDLHVLDSSPLVCDEHPILQAFARVHKFYVISPRVVIFSFVRLRSQTSGLKSYLLSILDLRQYRHPFFFIGFISVPSTSNIRSRAIVIKSRHLLPSLATHSCPPSALH
jgi:hypothetical protein